MTTTGEPGRWYVVITTSDGQRRRWRKNGREHTLAAELGPVWIANFRPAMFQALADGSLVARGSDPQALDVATVELEPS